MVYQLDKLAGVRTLFGAGGVHQSGLEGHHVLGDIDPCGPIAQPSANPAALLPK